MASAPASVKAVADAVEDRLAALLDAETARWAALTPDLAWPLDALRRLVLAGGKRLRPSFCYWAFVGAGGDPDDHRVVDAGAAFELLHAFALMHDDVMDDSDTRRGLETIHAEFAAHHADAGWGGESRRFGEGVAILVGDLAHVFADRVLPTDAPELAAVWDELRIELNIGQYLDVLGTARADRDEAGARRIARYKSGKYTIERPLHVGAALAGRHADLAAPLSAYGDPLGEAFQLRDDVLGVFGDTSLTGKPVGGDLLEGKPTPMLAVAVERADASQRAALDQVGRAELSERDVATLQAVLVDTGAREEIEASIERLTATAIAAVEQAPLTHEARRALVDLAHYVAERER
ncbi:MAG: polyprenyl synthetase family protein [Acidimicrobiales bacterium]|nr:polyprenyl synthetase family protein [Acidimicrobiales bacterium]